MKEQKRAAWYTRINKKKTSAILLTICLLGSVVGCNDNSGSLYSDDASSYDGSISGIFDSLTDFETGMGSSSSGETTEDYEDKDIIEGGDSSGSPEDFETETPNFGDDRTPTGSWDDYIGEEDESVYLQTELNNDKYRTQGGYSYFYHYQHGPTTMPIIAWVPPPPNYGNFTTNQITLENYQKMADCGFNGAYELYAPLHGVVDVDKTNVTNALNYSDQVGMVYYVKDSSLSGNLADYGKNALDNYYSWYMNKKAYAGTLTEDEPGMGNHINPFQKHAEANAIWKTHETYGKTKNMMVNNLPSYASAAQLYHGAGTDEKTAPEGHDYSGTNWAQFVKAYIDNVKPLVYSYDFYPFRAGSAQFSNYYYSLNAAREQAAIANIPYWVFCQVGYYNTPGAELTYAQTAIQVSTALAYGAKGIQWFNYWQPLEFSDNCISACVDHYGNKTKYYPWVQKINQHIASVDDVLMQCCNKGVIQIGTSYDTIYNKIGSYGALTSTSGSNGNALIGCFEYRDTGKYVYYVASNSYTNDASVNLTFDKAYNVKTVKGTTTMEYANRSSFTVNVPAGDGVLVVVG